MKCGPYKGGRNDGRQLSSGGMRGVKGCLVCGKQNREKHYHPREEVSEAIKRWKQRHPTALITVEDLETIFTQDEGQGSDGVSDGGEVRLEGKQEGEDSELTYLTCHQMGK